MNNNKDKNSPANEIKMCMDEIETTYDISKIKYGNEFIWPYLRIYVYSCLIEKKYNTCKEDHHEIRRHSKIYYFFAYLMRWVKVCFNTSFFLLRKQNDYLLFTDSMEVRKDESNYIDKIANGLIEELGNVVPVVKMLSSQSAFRFYIDYDLFDLCTSIYKRFVYFSPNMFEGREVLNLIQDTYNISFGNLDDIVRYILASQKIYSKFFSRVKPKCIFINYYYDFTKLPAIMIAKKMGIKTIELQHGMISDKHMAYNTKQYFADNPYPEYFFCFGHKFADRVSSYVYADDKIKVVGSYYIDMIRDKRSINKKIFEQEYGNLQNYKIITFAAQYINDEYSFECMREYANEHPEYFIIYVPRIAKCYHHEGETNNFKVETNLNVYQCMLNSNLTMTIYSTCAVESLALGTPVLLLNYRNQSMEMADFLGANESEFVRVTDKRDMDSNIFEMMCIDKKKVEEFGANFFEYGHKVLMKKAVSDLM